MAGFIAIHVFGRPGGYLGADGIGSIDLLILEGTSSRLWFESRPLARHVRPLGRLQVTVPQGADDPNALLDACLAFHADVFTSCPSFVEVERELGERTRLDFDLDADALPQSWSRLREEARPMFADLPRWVAHPELVGGPEAPPASGRPSRTGRTRRP